jgi:hypothetical protein
MKRHLVVLVSTLAVLAALPIVRTRAQAPTPAPAPAAGQAPAPGPGAAPGQGRGRGRQQGPPPPPITCTSPALPTDNKVPEALAKQGFKAIFNGKDLTGWQALIDLGTLKLGEGLDPDELKVLSPAEKAQKQKESNDVYLKHWSVVDGILVFDGIVANKETGEKGGQNLQTVKEYDDIDLYVDWCMEQGADSGVYLKNSPQIQMWFNQVGSGGLYNNTINTAGRNPMVVADNPAERWNTFHIIMEGDDLTTVWLNGKLVVDNVKMDNYWTIKKKQPERGLAPRGNIELQYHGHRLYWKNIYLKELN